MEKEEILQMFNCKFGKDIALRCNKLTEEYHELMEVLDRPLCVIGSEEYKEFTSDFIDELADVNAVVFQLAPYLPADAPYVVDAEQL